MKTLRVSFGKAAAMLFITASLSAQYPQQLNLLAGTQLSSGLGLGINTFPDRDRRRHCEGPWLLIETLF
jgi:hypothetical protein